MKRSDLAWLKEYQPVGKLVLGGEYVEASPPLNANQVSMLIELMDKHSTLDEREKTILTARLVDRKTYAAIGKQIGTSTSRPQQIYVKAIKKLKWLVHKLKEIA